MSAIRPALIATETSIHFMGGRVDFGNSVPGLFGSLNKCVGQHITISIDPGASS
jgi:hypothetical protein